MSRSEIKYKEIFQSGRYSNLHHLSDAKILTDDGCSFDVHKIILASSSDFFRAMFSEMYKSESEYRISNINGECMGNILQSIYTKSIYVTQMNVKDLLLASDYFLLKDLYFMLKHYIKSNITDANCLKLYYAGYQLNESEILQRCLMYIQKRFENIFLSFKDDLADLPLELVKNILSNRNLNVKSERIVWEAIIYWTQSCCVMRLSDVPSLLSALAIDEIDNNLATEILNHDIVKKNIHKKFFKEFVNFNKFAINSNRDRLINYLHIFSIDFKLQNFRIPRKLNVISMWNPEYGEMGTCEIYISYDESHSLWRKITHLNFELKYIATIGSDLYVFEKFGDRCQKFNLIKMEWKPMQNFDYFWNTVLVIENCLYILELDDHYELKKYNVEENKWFRVASLENVYYASAVVFGKSMLVVGLNVTRTAMIAQLLSPLNHLWSPVASPNILRSEFKLVTYNDKVYVIGGKNSIDDAILTIEVYDSETDIWIELPILPIDYRCVAVTILNDQMILYDVAFLSKSHKLQWNDTKKCWEKLKNSKLPEYLDRYRMCSVFDDETIKLLTKQNRSIEVSMEKCPLYYE